MDVTVPLLGGTARADATAVVDADRGVTVSHGALAERVDAARARLVPAAGPGRSLVLCLSDLTLDHVVAYLAAMEAGHAVLLLDGALPPEQHAQIVSAYRPPVVLGAGAQVAPASWAAGYRPHAVVAGEVRAWVAAGAAPVPLHRDLAVLLPTSGSTGLAKLVRLTRAAVRENAGAIVEALEIADHDRALANLPLSYSYGLSVLHSHLLAGAAVVLTRGSAVERRFWRAAAEHRCTSVAGVPLFYQTLRRLRVTPDRLATIRRLTQAGGRLDDATLAHFLALAGGSGRRFTVMYGQTEATARMSVMPPGREREKAGAVGLPVRGSGFTIEPPEPGAGVAAGGPGEVVFHGPAVMMGYAERVDDLASGDLLSGRLRTGDLGQLDDEGFLRLTGRTGRFAKVGGLRLHLDHVEQRLEPLGRFAAIAHDEVLLLFHEGHLDPGARGRLLDAASRALGLSRHHLEIEPLAELPRGPAGKIRYAALVKGPRARRR